MFLFLGFGPNQNRDGSEVLRICLTNISSRECSGNTCVMRTVSTLPFALDGLHARTELLKGIRILLRRP
jgi:hypothetical protein